MSLTYDHLKQIFKTHPSLKLLRADYAPLILSFFDRIFMETNVRSVSQSDMISNLDNTLFRLRKTEG